MRRRAEVAGLPVVVIDSGRVLGHVTDAVFDLDNGRLDGLKVSARGAELYLPFAHVYNLGATAVTVGAEAVLQAEVPRGSGFPKGRRVLTRGGELLGLVDDVIFDPDSGAVWGYEMTGGFIADFVEGRKTVPLTDEIVIGPDALVIPEDERPPGSEGGSEE